MKKQNNDKLDAMEEKAMNAMDNMSVPQQEQLVDFWGGFKSFFTDLMGWIGRAWNKVLEAIKALWTEVRNVVTGIFRGIKKALNIFNPFSWWPRFDILSRLSCKSIEYFQTMSCDHEMNDLFNCYIGFLPSWFFYCFTQIKSIITYSLESLDVLFAIMSLLSAYLDISSQQALKYTFRPYQ